VRQMEIREEQSGQAKQAGGFSSALLDYSTLI